MFISIFLFLILYDVAIEVDVSDCHKSNDPLTKMIIPVPPKDEFEGITPFVIRLQIYGSAATIAKNGAPIQLIL